MQNVLYRGFAVWGHAIREQSEILERDRFSASGTVTKDGKFVEASGVLGIFDSEDAAHECGLSWARALVGNHS
jgi:hypothetical protein